jgi:hypothetical protein
VGDLDKPMWLFAEADLDKVDQVRAEGAVYNYKHWGEQPAIADMETEVSIVDLR